MPGRPRFTRDVRFVFRRLERYHGVVERVGSERLHRLEQLQGLPGDTDVILDYTGNVFHPVTGEWVGSLTEGGGRAS